MTANGYRFGAGLVGTKVLLVGADETAYMYNTIGDAVEAAQNNDVIMVEPGTYTLTEILAINKPLTIKGMRRAGDKGVIITGALASELVKVDLVAQSASAEVVFEDIYFLHTVTDQPTVKVDNASMGNYKLKVRFVDCVVELASATTTAYAIDVDHTGVAASNEIQMKLTGQGWHKVHGVNFDVADDQDSLELVNMVLEPKGALSGVNSSNTAKTFLITLKNCIATHEKAVSGGNAGQTVASIGSVSKTGFTYAAIDTNDLIGSQAEVIA